jgi:hypothetical protein
MSTSWDAARSTRILLALPCHSSKCVAYVTKSSERERASKIYEFATAAYVQRPQHFFATATFGIFCVAITTRYEPQSSKPSSIATMHTPVAPATLQY